ncbi:enoyl-CoA hydratase [Pseudomonas fragi]|uniref:enoyl-CoA hydratase/isomerase family protein n=1 Tax=Pseudomonas fragi TaxID=296 RepID=UPI000BA2325C|nr:enoyl-CoA hydratase-related protein [Pseudomonas fragi]MBM1198358.1 enoyl-CoA hydratase [Pseudomonas fragi]NNA83913.1 enoyl-CoA hydratase [Pseudomonas fragi]NNB16356.1 enoyl-CoA hydratase [Pseudomonas fragi]NNB22311.1 enoyl-CoA hydratase [Pseudomonas fragi]NNB40027.1 enoyl-CoA hydratase [Pseudomonas fragi]
MSIEFEKQGPVAVITINRPQAMNAIDLNTHLAFQEIWPRINQDDDIQVVVLTGAGSKAFCSGADIGTFLPYLRERAVKELDDGDFCGINRGSPTTKPIIAAINGLAYAGGLEIALACDVRIAVEHARFALPEPRWGVIAGAGGVTRLSRVLPTALATQMVLTGEPVSAQRALAEGLVSELTSAENLLPRALEIAHSITKNAPLAVRVSLQVIRRGADCGLDAALELERTAFRRVLLSEDFREGIAAFTEKRVPAYQGR